MFRLGSQLVKSTVLRKPPYAFARSIPAATFARAMTSKASTSKVVQPFATGFRALIDLPPQSKQVLPGNIAFALGVVHAGFHAADGYPGTPSTEVIDRGLSKARDRINAGWSVNEATAVGVALGHSVAGQDALVTMKIPGVFHAADAITSSAFFNTPRGALVYYVVTDYIPASTQHVIDPRPFFAASRIPILEPHSTQSLYEAPRIAADMSRKFKTPVVILASDTLAHSEGLMVTGAARTVPKLEISGFQGLKTLPVIAAQNYKIVMEERIPAVQQFYQETGLVAEISGEADWGIIVNGNGYPTVKEALSGLEKQPSILLVSGVYPLPEQKIHEFSSRFAPDKLAVIEDGDRYLTDQVELSLGRKVLGKLPGGGNTYLTPVQVLQLLSEHQLINDVASALVVPELPNPIPRPPTICPGCPYKPFDLEIQKLKEKGKVLGVFGDIGCSSLLPRLDTIVYMGGSDVMRQGFAMSDPDKAGKYISVMGDSVLAHTGLDAIRNAIFKGSSGVTVILNNQVIAMTGGQPCPTSDVNSVGEKNKFDLEKVLKAEGAHVITADSYSVIAVRKALREALKAADAGQFVSLVLSGQCLGLVNDASKLSSLEVDKAACKGHEECGRCDVCDGIDTDAEGKTEFNALCNNCGSGDMVCMQLCPYDAMQTKAEERARLSKGTTLFSHEAFKASMFKVGGLPSELRIAIRGIGGQGNLFFGKVLGELFLQTPHAEENILKGETHGMAQLGGPVMSTFASGSVFSPVFAPGTADVLVVMEMSELLRPGFLTMLKPGGTLLVNDYAKKPTFFAGEYPNWESIAERLRDRDYKIIKVPATDIALRELGDPTGKRSNVLMLGLLSTIAPFDTVPREHWLTALKKVSGSEKVLQGNCDAFSKGYALGSDDAKDESFIMRW